MGDVGDAVKDRVLSVARVGARIGLGTATGGLSELGGDPTGFLDKPDAPAAATPPTPPPPPDLTDETVRQARLAALRRLGAGTGLSSTFLTGPMGDPPPPGQQAPRIGGSS